MNGLMEDLIKENGKKIICMVKDYINGLMDDVMMVVVLVVIFRLVL